MLADEAQMAVCCNSCQHSNGVREGTPVTVQHIACHSHQGPLSQPCTHCLTPLVPITGPARSGCLHKAWQLFLTQHIEAPYPPAQQYTLWEANLQLRLSCCVSTCAPFMLPVNIKYTSEQPLLSLLYLPGRRRIYLADSAIDLTHYLRVKLAFLLHVWFLITIIMQSQWRCNFWDAAFSWSSASSESGVANTNIS